MWCLKVNLKNWCTPVFQKKWPLIVYGEGELVITSKSFFSEGIGNDVRKGKLSWGNLGQVPCGAKSAGTVKCPKRLKHRWKTSFGEERQIWELSMFLARRWPSMMLGGWPAWRGCLGFLWCVADLSVALCAPQPSFLARMASIVRVASANDFRVRTTKKCWGLARLDVFY